MRVLLIHDGEGPLRGSEKVILDLMAGLSSQGVAWQVVTNQAEFKEAAEHTGFHAILIPFRPLFVGGTNWRYLVTPCGRSRRCGIYCATSSLI